MNPCSSCGNTTAETADVVDDGGGSRVPLCGRCFHGLTSDKCDMCGRERHEWSDGRPGRVAGGRGDGLLCPGCRRYLLDTAERPEGGVLA